MRPRLGNMPVHVVPELIQMFTDFGRPVSLEEIMAAWGRLREKRKNPLVSDMSALIAAQRRREARNLKRLTHTQRSLPNGAIAS